MPVDQLLVKNTLRGISTQIGEMLEKGKHSAHKDPKAEPDWHLIDEETGLLTLPADAAGSIDLELTLHPQLVILALCLEGTLEISFIQMAETCRVENSHSVFLSHPYAPIIAGLHIPPNASLLLILTTIQRMHSFFNTNLDISAMSREEMKQYYDPGRLYLVRPMSPSMHMAARQILNYNLGKPFLNMYMHGKVLEIFSIYFNNAATGEDSEASCPFLDNPEDVKCIRKAKQILLENLADPPTIAALSRLVGLNEFKLKNGFKEIYGNTIYGYLNDYRMQHAILMLEQRKYTVNEVAFSIGYAKPSNFIASFKKKFGVTPKKYLQELKA